MTRRIFSLITAVTFSMFLFGCGQSGAPAGNQTAQANSTESEDSGAKDGANAASPYKVGYASLCEDNDFGVVSRENVEKMGGEAGWEMVIANNNYDGPTAIQNADMMITQQVDGFINFQVDAGVAPTVVEMMANAGIPMITIDCPHPDTPFFGANNEEAGLILGRALADKALEQWDGAVDLIVLCGAPGSGEVVDLRMQNIVTGIRERIEIGDNVPILDLDGNSEIETSQKVLTDTLTANPDKKNILIGALNDQSALGVFNAVEAANRQDDVFLGSHGCDAPAKNNLLWNEENFWIGSVAYFPERYGEYVVPLMEKLLAGEDIPDFSYPDHVFVNKGNIDQYYGD